MPASHGPHAARLRWHQILVLASVVVITDVAGVAWLTRDVHRPTPLADAEGAMGPATPSPEILDEEMSRAVRRFALQSGLNPSDLPELPQLWDEYSSVDLAAREVDVEDRAAVVAAFEGYLSGMSSTGPGGGMGVRGGGSGQRGGGGGTGQRSGGGGGGGGQGSGGGGAKPGVMLAPTIARFDEMQALRLTKLAQQMGVDPALVMPPDTLRQAALSSEDVQSDASMTLLETYHSTLMALDPNPEGD